MRVPRPNKTVQIGVRLTPALAKKVRRLAVRDKVSISDAVRKILERVKE